MFFVSSSASLCDSASATFLARARVALVVFGLRALALEHMQVERREAVIVEAQRGRAGRHRIIEIGAGPVDHRHHVVADGADAFGGDRPHALDPDFGLTRSAGAAALDVVRHRNALDHGPFERRTAGRRVLDERLALRDGLLRPDLARRVLMQRRDDLGRAGLAHMIERHRIVRPIPAPRLSHAATPFRVSDSPSNMVGHKFPRLDDWSGHLILNRPSPSA